MTNVPASQIESRITEFRNPISNMISLLHSEISSMATATGHPQEFADIYRKLKEADKMVGEAIESARMVYYNSL
jgi:hypothetical protein